MKEAERLLTHTTLSLEEIAVQCGIRTITIFNKVFKKIQRRNTQPVSEAKENPENRAAMEEIGN